MKTLIDTGSGVNAMCVDFWNKIGAPKLEPVEIHFAAVNRKTVCVTHRYIEERVQLCAVAERLRRKSENHSLSEQIVERDREQIFGAGIGSSVHHLGTESDERIHL